MQAKKPNKQQRELAADWDKLTDKWANVQSFGGKYGGTPTGRKPTKYVPPIHHLPPSKPVRSTTVAGVTVRSVPDSPGGSTALRPQQQYTGTAMLGVATMHKSNSVPVFRAEDAADIAKMRR